MGVLDSFNHFGTKVWNNFPNELRTQTDIKAFKRLIKTGKVPNADAPTVRSINYICSFFCFCFFCCIFLITHQHLCFYCYTCILYLV